MRVRVLMSLAHFVAPFTFHYHWTADRCLSSYQTSIPSGRIKCVSFHTSVHLSSAKIKNLSLSFYRLLRITEGIFCSYLFLKMNDVLSFVEWYRVSRSGKIVIEIWIESDGKDIIQENQSWVRLSSSDAVHAQKEVKLNHAGCSILQSMQTHFFRQFPSVRQLVDPAISQGKILIPWSSFSSLRLSGRRVWALRSEFLSRLPFPNIPGPRWTIMIRMLV